METLVASFILIVTMAGALALYVSYRNAWVITSLARNTSSEASMGLERIVYGVGTNGGLRAAEFGTVTVTFPSGGWRVNYNTNRFLLFDPALQNITDENGSILCEGVVNSTAALTNDGCAISVTVMDTGGGRTATNTMGSFIQFRN